jgi:hypothetical protein
VLHDFDVAHDLGVSPAERLRETGFLLERSSSIHALVASRLQISGDGKTLMPQYGPPEPLVDRQAVRIPLSFPEGAVPGTLGISAAMFPYDPMHQTFVNIYEEGELTRQVILNRFQNRVEHVTGTHQGAGAVIARFVLVIRHI